MMDLVASDGHIPEEVRRGEDGITYTQEAIQYKVGSAVLAARRGVDLWAYQGRRGDAQDGRGLSRRVRGHRGPVALGRARPVPDPGSAVGAGPCPLARAAVRALVMPAGRSAMTGIRPSAGPRSPRRAAAGWSGPSPSTAAVSRRPARRRWRHRGGPETPATRGRRRRPPSPRRSRPADVMLRAGAYPDLGHLPVRVDWAGIGTDDVRRYELQRMETATGRTRALNAGERTRHDEYAPTGTDLSGGCGSPPGQGPRIGRRPRPSTRFRGGRAGPQYGAMGARPLPATRGTASAGRRQGCEPDGRLHRVGGGVARADGPTRGRARVLLDGSDLGTVDLRARRSIRAGSSWRRRRRLGTTPSRSGSRMAVAPWPSTASWSSDRERPMLVRRGGPVPVVRAADRLARAAPGPVAIRVGSLPW